MTAPLAGPLVVEEGVGAGAGVGAGEGAPAGVGAGAGVGAEGQAVHISGLVASN